jgi:hypothetical protein
MDVRERAEKYIEYEPMSGCHIWTGATSGKASKPCLKIDGRSVDIGRYLYELEHGPVGENLTRIVCGTTRCVRPSHRRVIPPGRGVRYNRRKRSSALICAAGHRPMPTWAYMEAIRRTKCPACRRALWSDQWASIATWQDGRRPPLRFQRCFPGRRCVTAASTEGASASAA